MTLDKRTIVGVLGAGAMGSGIGLVAATAGHPVVIGDSFAPSLDKAKRGNARSLARDVEKGRLTQAGADEIAGRIRYADTSTDVDAFRGCGLVIEAIVEELGVKQSAFKAIEAVVDGDCVLASNTSSLSIAALASACRKPARMIGIHFFNPPTVLPLVEIVAALPSDTHIVAAARTLVDSWGKVTVLTADTPGFIVNRVARPFYGESLRLYEEQIADFATIDWAMKEVGGFKMGPFELMDLIGNDVNFAVSKSVFEALGYDPRYRPTITQRRLVEAGRFGRKTQLGYYDYRDGAAPPSAKQDRELGARIVDRVVAMLINEAADAVLFGIASPRDVDLAMTKGVNYPKGLLAWADEIGPRVVYERLVALQDEYGEDRYRPSALLRRHARDNRRFHA